jgi:hypothetical protein
LLPLLRIAQYLIGLVKRLDLAQDVRVVLLLQPQNVGMVLAYEPSVSSFNDIRFSLMVNLKNAIVIFERHLFSTTTQSQQGAGKLIPPGLAFIHHFYDNFFLSLRAKRSNLNAVTEIASSAYGLLAMTGVGFEDTS